MKLAIAVIAALFLVGCEGEGVDNVVVVEDREPVARPMPIDNGDSGGYL